MKNLDAPCQDVLEFAVGKTMKKNGQRKRGVKLTVRKIEEVILKVGNGSLPFFDTPKHDSSTHTWSVLFILLLSKNIVQYRDKAVHEAQ